MNAPARLGVWSEAGTLLTRTLTFTFSPLVRWAGEPILRRRLRGEVLDELRRAKAHLERAPAR